jgi:xanthine dehydrogenase accessory factor
MENDAESLMPLYRAASTRGDTLALATLVQTAGSTYRKAGAQMLIAADGQYAGLLSGGCLEGDLAARAREVIATGRAAYISYDMRGPDDAVWGLGSGCEGAMRILLCAVGPNTNWAPLVWLEKSLTASVASRYALVIDDRSSRFGACLRESEVESLLGRNDTLWIALTPPPALLICGAGPDAAPVAQFARLLGWRVFAADHRSAYLGPERFPAGVRLIESRPAPLAVLSPTQPFDAAVIMSHHLDTDRGWLVALAASPPAYVGLLGPAPRREKLLGELSATQRAALASVLRAPVGLDLGGRSPAAIALSIVSEIQAALHQRAGRPILRTSN